MSESLPDFLAGKQLRILGEGQEATVYTDEADVFKVFKNSENMLSYEQAEKIAASINVYGQPSFFYPLALLRSGRTNDIFAFKYPFEKSRPYTGGMAQDMAGFLLEACSMGIVSRNVHPDNFIITKSGLRFIDYGRDIRMYSESDFRQMVVRAWLSMRCWYRDDLKLLMRSALSGQNLPELEDFNDYYANICNSAKDSRFLPAPSFFSPRPQELELNPYIISKALEQEPKTILDYGCGKGKIAETLATYDIHVVAWDPDTTKIDINIKRNSSVIYEHSLKNYFKSKTHFDAIICSLVLCFISDDEAIYAIKNLRELINENGNVYIAICNPFFNSIKKFKYHYKKPLKKFSYFENSSLQAISPYTGIKFKDYHRPMEWYIREFGKYGFIMTEMRETNGLNPENGRAFSDYIFLKLVPVTRPTARATLLIRACALECDSIEVQVRHIVRQLAVSPFIANVFVQVDTRTDNFTRSYGEPNLHVLLEKLDKLKTLKIIDDILLAPNDDCELRKINWRWFRLDSTAMCSEKKEPTAASLNAFEKCPNEYIVAVDADIMLLKNTDQDPIKEAIEFLEDHPKAVTVSLNIMKYEYTQLHAQNSDGQNSRVEVRAGVFHKDRLLHTRPLKNSAKNDFLALSWYRSLDQTLQENGGESLRGGSGLCAFVHTPNTYKTDKTAWFEVLDRIEAGYVPDTQYGAVDLCVTGTEWYGPKRHEPFVFVLTGRNVAPDKLKRCFDSLTIQDGPEWGAVVFDDASDDGSASYLESLCGLLKYRVTLIKNRIRCGLLPNLIKAVKYYVANENSVILTLDSDDALLDANSLSIVANIYADGADMTVGSMLRTDRPNMRYAVNFDNPRKNRNGNVWQHLRTFKKYLFDAINIDDLKIDGQWITRATDWTFMLPMVEMADNPIFIKKLLYLYDPSEYKLYEKIQNQVEREHMIATISAKPTYSKLEYRGQK